MNLLTSKDLQNLLQVDRSTIYRMAEAGRLPAVKVGRQWRFPSDQIDQWLNGRTGTSLEAQPPSQHNGSPSSLFPPSVQDQIGFIGELLGVMIVITDMDGRPLMEAANPCGLFEAIDNYNDAIPRCVVGWKKLADEIDLEPRFTPSHMGLLCARSFVRVGTELKAMVLIGGIAPHDWPPQPAEAEEIAQAFAVPLHVISQHASEVYQLDDEQRLRVLAYLPRVTRMLSQIANERTQHLANLQAIVSLAGVEKSTKENS